MQGLIDGSAVKGSDNPALYQAYLEKYPDGNFAPAKAKLIIPVTHPAMMTR